MGGLWHCFTHMNIIKIWGIHSNSQFYECFTHCQKLNGKCMTNISGQEDFDLSRLFMVVFVLTTEEGAEDLAFIPVVTWWKEHIPHTKHGLPGLSWEECLRWFSDRHTCSHSGWYVYFILFVSIALVMMDIPAPDEKISAQMKQGHRVIMGDHPGWRGPQLGFVHGAGQFSPLFSVVSLSLLLEYQFSFFFL